MFSFFSPLSPPPLSIKYLMCYHLMPSLFTPYLLPIHLAVSLSLFLSSSSFSPLCICIFLFTFSLAFLPPTFPLSVPHLLATHSPNSIDEQFGIRHILHAFPGWKSTGHTNVRCAEKSLNQPTSPNLSKYQILDIILGQIESCSSESGKQNNRFTPYPVFFLIQVLQNNFQPDFIFILSQCLVVGIVKFPLSKFLCVRIDIYEARTEIKKPVVLGWS